MYAVLVALARLHGAHQKAVCVIAAVAFGFVISLFSFFCSLRKIIKTTMASKAARIAAVANQIFGTVPNRGVRTGMQYLKKPLTGAYEARYYMEPIEPIARKVRCLMFVETFCFFAFH